MINKKLVKKTAAITITGALAIAMTATVMAGPGGPGGGMQGGPGQEMQGSSTGERPEMPSGEEGIPRDSSDASKPAGYPDTEVGVRGEAPSGERPEMPNRDSQKKEMQKPGGNREDRTDHMGQNTERPGINTEEIANAIEAIEDEDVKANLETLKSDYESAKKALEDAIEKGSGSIDIYREAEAKAMEALREALKDAGIETEMQNGKPGDAQGQPGENMGGNQVRPNERPGNNQSMSGGNQGMPSGRPGDNQNQGENNGNQNMPGGRPGDGQNMPGGKNGR